MGVAAPARPRRPARPDRCRGDRRSSGGCAPHRPAGSPAAGSAGARRRCSREGGPAVARTSSPACARPGHAPPARVATLLARRVAGSATRPSDDATAGDRRTSRGSRPTLREPVSGCGTSAPNATTSAVSSRARRLARRGSRGRDRADARSASSPSRASRVAELRAALADAAGERDAGGRTRAAPARRRGARAARDELARSCVGPRTSGSPRDAATGARPSEPTRTRPRAAARRGRRAAAEPRPRPAWCPDARAGCRADVAPGHDRGSRAAAAPGPARARRRLQRHQAAPRRTSTSRRSGPGSCAPSPRWRPAGASDPCVVFDGQRASGHRARRPAVRARSWSGSPRRASRRTTSWSWRSRRPTNRSSSSPTTASSRDRLRAGRRRRRRDRRRSSGSSTRGTGHVAVAATVGPAGVASVRRGPGEGSTPWPGQRGPSPGPPSAPAGTARDRAAPHRLHRGRRAPRPRPRPRRRRAGTPCRIDADLLATVDQLRAVRVRDGSPWTDVPTSGRARRRPPPRPPARERPDAPRSTGTSADAPGRRRPARWHRPAPTPGGARPGRRASPGRPTSTTPARSSASSRRRSTSSDDAARPPPALVGRPHAAQPGRDPGPAARRTLGPRRRRRGRDRSARGSNGGCHRSWPSASACWPRPAAAASTVPRARRARRDGRPRPARPRRRPALAPLVAPHAAPTVAGGSASGSRRTGRPRTATWVMDPDGDRVQAASPLAEELAGRGRRPAPRRR